MVAGAARRELGTPRAVSLINKMLQELDRRNALGSADGPVPPQQGRAVSAPGAGAGAFACATGVAAGWAGGASFFAGVAAALRRASSPAFNASSVASGRGRT